MTERKQNGSLGSPGKRAFFVPVAWIVALLASYWVIVDWQAVPAMFSQALARIH